MFDVSLTITACVSIVAGREHPETCFYVFASYVVVGVEIGYFLRITCNKGVTSTHSHVTRSGSRRRITPSPLVLGVISRSGGVKALSFFELRVLTVVVRAMWNLSPHKAMINFYLSALYSVLFRKSAILIKGCVESSVSYSMMILVVWVVFEGLNHFL